MNIPELPKRWRVFLREPGNPYKDFTDIDEAWSYAQSFTDQGPQKIPYIHTIEPGGSEFPTGSNYPAELLKARTK